MTDSRLFRLLRRLGSIPSVLILTGLVLGGISAGQAIAEFFNHAIANPTSLSAKLNGQR